MRASLPVAGDARGIESAQQGNDVEFERTAPSQDIQVANGCAAIECRSRGRGVGEEPLHSNIGLFRRDLSNPLIGQGGHAHVVGVGITDTDSEGSVWGDLQASAFVLEQLDAVSCHRESRYGNRGRLTILDRRVDLRRIAISPCVGRKIGSFESAKPSRHIAPAGGGH